MAHASAVNRGKPQEALGRQLNFLAETKQRWQVMHTLHNAESHLLSLGRSLDGLPVTDCKGADIAAGESLPDPESVARRFDLVVGADGLHSIVRRLVFGADPELVRHAGLYAATIPLPGRSDPKGEMFMLNTPGKVAALHPCEGKPLAYFVFWRPEIPEFDCWRTGANL
jgi:2-polyprenyl-6-methoxyphenol hydroxylase-like FAD-dependent oxidoreductase